MASALKSGAKFAAKLLIVIVCSLAVLEAALQLYFYPSFDFFRVSEFDEYKWARLKPGADKIITNKIRLSLFAPFIKFRYPVKINSQGLRADTDYALSPASPAYRVICIGDSVTFGWNLEGRYSYPALLEQELNRLNPGLHAQVINAGYPSYTSRQGLIWLDQQLLDLHPNLVIAQFGFNDSLPSWLRMSGPIFLGADREVMAGTPGSWQPIPAGGFRRLTDLLVSHTIIGKVPLFLYSVATQPRRPSGPKPDEDAAYQRARVPLEDFRDNLLEIARLCREHRVRLILIDAWGVPPEYRDAIRQFAKANALEVFSQAAVMEQGFLGLKDLLGQDQYRPYLEKIHARFNDKFLEKNKIFYLGVDWLHPNELGNLLIARKLSEFILAGEAKKQ